MASVVISIISLLLGIGILLLGHGLIGTVLTLRAAAEQYSDMLIGLIMAAYFVGYIVGTFYCPRLINRVGHIRAFAVVAAVSAVIIIAHGFFVDPWVWLTGRLVFGACVVSVYMIVESWLNSRTDNALRGRVFAIYTIVTLSALAAGQFLLLAGDIRTLELFALAGALFSLSLVPIALTKIAEPAPVPVVQVDLKGLYALAPLALIASLLAGVVSSAFFSLGPLFAHDMGLAEGAVALFMAATIAGGALFQWPLGRWSDRIDRRRVLMLAGFGAAVAAAAMVPAGNTSPPALMLLAVVYGGLAFAVYPLSVALANDQVSSGGDAVGISGSLLLAYGLGATAGPLLAGGLMEVAGPDGLVWFFAGCWLVLGAAALQALWRRTPAVAGEKEAFMPMTRTSPVALEAQIEAQHEATASETASS